MCLSPEGPYFFGYGYCTEHMFELFKNLLILQQIDFNNK